MRFSRIPVLLSLLALSLPAASLARDETYSLVRKVAVGDTAKNAMTVAMEVQGQKVELCAMVLEKVLAVEKDGSYQLESKETELKFKMGGQEYPGDEEDGEGRKTTYDIFGTPMAVKGTAEDEAPESVRLEFLTAFIAPKDAKKIGDKWSMTTEPDKKFGVGPVKSDFELVKLDKVGDKECVLIKSTTEETSGTKPAKAEKSYWLDVKTFDLIKMEADITSAPLPGMPDPIDLKFSLLRQ